MLKSAVSPATSVISPSQSAQLRETPLSSPSYLYRRGNLYYFRYALPEQYKRYFCRREIRISLRTGYRREAKHLAVRLFSELMGLLEGTHMLSYDELRKRMNGYLRLLLEQEDRDLAPRLPIEAPGLRLTPGAYSERTADILMMAYEHNPDTMQRDSGNILSVLVRDGVIRPEEITEENKLQIIQAYTRMQISRHKIIAAREKGDFLTEQAVFSAPYTPIPLGEETNDAKKDIPPGEPLRQQPRMLLSKAIDQYIETKLSDGAWTPHSVPDHRNRLTALVEILGDMDILDIDRKDMRHYRETLRKLPPNRSKSPAFKGKTIGEILAMEPERTLNVNTVNIMVEAAATMFDWCIREELMTSNPAKGLQLKDERQSIELRDSFTHEELQRIFAHPKFTQGTFAHPAYFWIPLIGLYTGMRLEEIAQLHCADMYESDAPGIWVFDVNDTPSGEGTVTKRLKTKNARRIVPVHPDLIAAGLLRFHASRKEAGQLRLFPELRQTERTTKLGKQPGKMFKRIVDDLGISGKKSFHSLRHTFSDFFKQRMLQHDVFLQVFGHENEKLAANQYGGKFPAKTCYEEIIVKLDYGLDVSCLKPPESS